MASQTTAFVAVLISLSMVTTLPPRTQQAEEPLQALSNDLTFVIEGLDFINHVDSFNPFNSYYEQERMVIRPCMSTLLTYDPHGDVIGDVADTWTVSPDGRNWSFTMRPDIYFCDPLDPAAKTHKMTWMDVQYTYFQVQNYSNGLQRYLLYDSAGIIDRIWGSTDENWINISLILPFAPFTTALTEIPIVPKYYWEPHEDHAGDATWWPGYGDEGYTSLPLVGSGPMYCGMTEADLHGSNPIPTEVTLHRNPIWFQETYQGWNISVDKLVYRQMNVFPDEWSDLALGKTDMIMDVPRSVYTNDLAAHPSILAWAQTSGGYFEYNLNQMTTEMRAYLGKKSSAIAGGQNSQLLQDPIIKRALTMALDRESFVNQILEGVGNPGDSVVAEANPWHYDPVGQVAFDIAGANTLLGENGYQDTDADGVRECTVNSPAVQKGWAAEGDEVSVRFFTLGGLVPGDQPPEFQTGAELIRDWAAQIGIRLDLSMKTFSQMISVWLAADYDAWLWDWESYAYSDPSLDIMYPLTTMATSLSSMWTDVWWSNATFDSVYNSSLAAGDPVKRRTLTNQLQQLAYDCMASHPVAFVCDLYACNCSRWARSSFEGCGVEWTMSPDSALPWLFMQLVPAPPVDMLPLSPIAGTDGETLDFNASAYSQTGLPLTYVWEFGDGSEPQSGNPVTHAYVRPGNYTFTVTVDDGSGLTAHTATSSAVATIGFEIDLLPGWNLIGMPLNKTFWASEIGLTPGEVIVSHNSTTRSYDHFYIANMSPKSTDFLLTPCRGYWVYSHSARSLILYGTPADPQEPAIDLPPGGGWALLSSPCWPFTRASLTPGNISVIARWDAQEGQYQTYIPGLPVNDFYIYPDEGFWAYFQGSGTFTHSS